MHIVSFLQLPQNLLRFLLFSPHIHPPTADRYTSPFARPPSTDRPLAFRERFEIHILMSITMHRSYNRPQNYRFE